jgi:threonine dehydrogenase-like Zn-dependent dehydrogenase
MRAAVFHAAGSPLSIDQVPDPHPAAGEVLIEVARAGICGSDLQVAKLGAAAPGTIFILPLPGFLKELSISFAQCYHERDFAAVIDAIARGEVAPQFMHTATVGFDELPEVFDSLRGASPHCKVLIDPAR